MRKVAPVTYQGSDDRIYGYMFRCPGCGDHHLFYTSDPRRPMWTFNGSLDKPTFLPSLLTKSGCYVAAHKPGDDCWCNYESRYGKPSPAKCYRCHLFVTDGRIQFLDDCTHELKGQTVDLPDWTE